MSWNKRVTVSPFEPATSSPAPLTTIAIGKAAYTHKAIPRRLPTIAVPSPIPPGIIGHFGLGFYKHWA